MPAILNYKKKIRALLIRIQGWIQSTGVFKDHSQGDTFEIMMNMLVYEKHCGNDLFTKEHLKKVLEYNKTIKEEYYDDMDFVGKDLE